MQISGLKWSVFITGGIMSFFVGRKISLYQNKKQCPTGSFKEVMKKVDENGIPCLDKGILPILSSQSLCYIPSPETAAFYLHGYDYSFVKKIQNSGLSKDGKETSDLGTIALANQGVLHDVFSMMHHPDTVKAEILFTDQKEVELNHMYNKCNSVYLTRTGSMTHMSNKCLSIVKIRDGTSSPYVQSNRLGNLANLTDQYQADYLDTPAQKNEAHFLQLFLHNRLNLVSDFIDKFGDPFITGSTTNERRDIVVLVANEGVIDLVLNFICSCKEASINISNKIVIFVGQEELIPLIENMGVATFYHEALGKIPKRAAGFYGDDVFGILMWLKTTSVYVASAAGFNVLFQDADLVWLKDPFPYFQNHPEDIVFMDDVYRPIIYQPTRGMIAILPIRLVAWELVQWILSLPFLPWVNSGFYYQKYNERTQFLMERMIKSIAEISVTHSHQSTLTRHIIESHHLIGINFHVLEQSDFPSGIVYHHNKKFIKKMIDYQVFPSVFHMCWTSSREDKVRYFKDIGMWFLPVNNTAIPHCETSTSILSWYTEKHDNKETVNVVDSCCLKSDYWLNYPQTSNT
eukprot:gene12701-17032_t